MGEERLSELPDDLLYTIFLSIPPKSLANCLSVCNSWKSFLSSYEFVSTQLSLESTKTYTPPDSFTNTDEDRCAMLFHSNGRLHFSQDNKCLEKLMKGDAQGCFSVGVEEFPLCKVYEPSLDKYLSVKVVGFSGGVFCLKVTRSMDEYQVMLWNPTINRCMILMRSHDRSEILTCGFGFDPIFKDHKMVVILQDIEDLPCPYNYDEDNYNDGHSLDYFKCRYTALLYSLGNGCWKSLPLYSKSYIISISETPIFINGVVHWLVHSIDDKEAWDMGIQDENIYILTFDIYEEFFDTIKLPQDVTLMNTEVLSRYITRCSSPDLALIAIKDALAVIRYDCYKGGKITVWTMEEYGNVNSWTILQVIDMLDPEVSVERNYYCSLRLSMGWGAHASCTCTQDSGRADAEKNDCPMKRIYGPENGLMETLLLANKEGEERSQKDEVQTIKGETIDLKKLSENGWAGLLIS